MLIEQCAYNNHWRQVPPAAKALFTACGIVAAFVSRSPLTTCGLAGIMAAVTLAGAKVPPFRYLKVALPALLFLAVSAATLAVSVSWGGLPLRLQFQVVGQAEIAHIALTCSRSLCGIAALLFLSLTTSMTDIIALLRRLRFPEVMLDIMTLGYRTVFVFLEVIHDTRIAQMARLGYATPRLAMRSLGILTANLAIQVWQRSNALHQAASARNNDGPLIFLEGEYHRPIRSLITATVSGCALIALALVTI